MYKDYKGGDDLKRISILVALAIILNLFTSVYSSQLNEVTNFENSSSITQLNDEEFLILDQLYLIQQEINEMEITEKKIKQEIDNLQVSIQELEKNIEDMTKSYDNNLDIMESVLKSYQKNGALNYLQLILNSKDLPTLLRRINSIREVSRNTSNLLEIIDKERDELLIEKTNLDNNLLVLDNTRKQLEETLANKLEIKTTLESRLNELMDEKQKYLTYLDELNNRWIQSKPIFEEVIKQLVKIVETGDLPPDLIETKISLARIYGIINEDLLNVELSKKGLSTPLTVIFRENEMVLNLRELQLIIHGSLEQIDDQTLRFNMTKGQYMGLNLEKSSLEELFDFGYLDLRFSTLLGRNKIRSVKIYDGYLELNILPVLF